MSKARQAADEVNRQQAGRRNLIINGAMQVAQRGTSVTGNTTGGYTTVDRFKNTLNSSGTFTISQSTEAPAGFTKSLKYDCTTADASPNYNVIYNLMEGRDAQHLEFGTSNAKSLTLSFWVRSSKTGTYQVNLAVYSSVTRMIGATYNISTADTWEKKVITFEGDTAGYNPDNDSTTGLKVEWWLGSGSTFTGGAVPTSWEAEATADRAAGNTVHIGTSTDDDFYLTGVQLEVGDVATPFEHRSYGEELALCQRYYETFSGRVCGYSTTYLRDTLPYKVTKRATPTVTETGSINSGGTSVTLGAGGTKDAWTFSASLTSYGYSSTLTADAEL